MLPRNKKRTPQSNMAATRPHGVVHQAKFLQINPPKNENAKEDRYNHQFDGVHREDGEGHNIRREPPPSPRGIRSRDSALLNKFDVPSLCPSGLTLQTLVAFAVIAASLFNPLQSAVCIIRFVGPVLIEAGFHTRLACRQHPNICLKLRSGTRRYRSRQAQALVRG